MAIYEPVPRRKNLIGQAVWVVVWLAVTVIGASLHASADGHGTHTQLGFPPCPSVLLFNRPCPGCGLTTSWTAFIHGQFVQSFQAHPLGPVVYALFTISAFLALRGVIRKERLMADSPKATRWIVTGAVLFFCFGMARMALTPHYRSSVDLAAMAREESHGK